MTFPITWDDTTKRFFETGIDHGTLYIQETNGTYITGFPWNGLTAITESPSGAEPNPQYADNIKYLNLVSTEEFGLTIEAYTYPEEFAQCDGSLKPGSATGVVFGQQPRKTFGLSYRTRLGNDVSGDALGYKLHLVYGCLASPSEKAYSSVNDSPEALTFSWEVTTTPVAVTNYQPVSIITINSTTADPTKLAALLVILYGTGATAPRLPLPSEIITLMTP